MISDAGSMSIPPRLGDGLTFIEQLHANSVSDCPNAKDVWVIGVNTKARHVIMFHPNCKVWSCPTCGARNGKRWLARIINGMNKKGGKWSFLTITAHERWRGQTASIANLRKGWKKLYNRLHRRVQVTYALVWEFHKDTSFHLHILMNLDCEYLLSFKGCGKPKKMLKASRWVKDTARQCGMGYQVVMKPVDNAGQAAGYIAKYMLKSFELAKFYPAGIRRVVVSEDFPKLPDLTKGKLNDYKWIRPTTDEGAINTVQAFFRRGYDIDGGEKLESE